jgi:hypothetical protein
MTTDVMSIREIPPPPSSGSLPTTPCPPPDGTYAADLDIPPGEARRAVDAAVVQRNFRLLEAVARSVAGQLDGYAQPIDVGDGDTSALLGDFAADAGELLNALEDTAGALRELVHVVQREARRRSRVGGS